jgi:hypothetical protein
MCAVQIMKIHINFAGTKKGGMTKKAKRSSTVNVKSNNENPHFTVKMTETYITRRFLVSLLLKMSSNFGFN